MDAGLPNQASLDKAFAVARPDVADLSPFTLYIQAGALVGVVVAIAVLIWVAWKFRHAAPGAIIVGMVGAIIAASFSWIATVFLWPAIFLMGLVVLVGRSRPRVVHP